MYRIKMMVQGKTIYRAYVTLMGAITAYARFKELNPEHLVLTDHGDVISRYRVFNYRTRQYEKSNCEEESNVQSQSSIRFR